jgi:RNA polymerase sigma factor (sigma-70 family)
VAWDLLVHRYERLVFSVAMRNGLARPDAADVTQATFLVLLESLDSIEDDRRLASWLMTVARRQAWRLKDRWAREAPVGLHDPPGDPDVDDFVSWERVATLHEALDRLGSPCSDLLRALYLDPGQPSYAALATRLGRRIGSIGPMRSRCLNRLRSLLAEEGA